MNATTVRHWHVQRHGEDEWEPFETVFHALQYAGDELDRMAEFEHEAITMHGDDGQFEEAYRCFQRSERYAGLAANAHNMYRQWSSEPGDRAPLYQDLSTAPGLLLTAAEHAVKEIIGNGPIGFTIWECSLEGCAPAGDE